MAPRPRTTTSYAIGINAPSNAGEMPGPPFADRIDDRHEAAAVDQAGRGQCLKLAAQHPGRDLRRAVAAAQQAAADLAIAPRAVLEVPQDADLVLAAHHLLERQH